MSASNYLENKVLDHVLGSSAYTQPSALYVALSTGSFNDDNSGTELTGNGYTRKVVTFGTASSGSISSNSNVEFDTATGSSGVQLVILEFMMQVQVVICYITGRFQVQKLLKREMY